MTALVLLFAKPFAALLGASGNGAELLIPASRYLIGIDVVTTAARYGISSDRAVNYHADSMGTQTVFESVGEVFSAVRERRAVPPSWREDAERDFNSRSRGKG